MKEGQGSAGTPLTLAAKWGYIRVAEFLLSRGASKSNAIEKDPDYDKELIEGFFDDLERVTRLRPELESKRRQLEVALLHAEKPELLPTTCKGITIAGLRKLKAVIQSECESGRFREDQSYPDGTSCKGTMKYEELTVTDMVYRYVKEVNSGVDLCLADNPGLFESEHKAIPSLFISHAWRGRFSKLLDGIFTYVKKQRLSDGYAVWLDLVAVNQSADTLPTSLPTNFLTATFQDVLKTCIDGTLVVCDFECCVTSTRAWCLYEWDWTMHLHGREAMKIVGLSVEEAEEGMNNIEVGKAKCFKLQDQEMILGEIIKKHSSLESFDEKLRKKWGDVAYEVQANI